MDLKMFFQELHQRLLHTYNLVKKPPAHSLRHEQIELQEDDILYYSGASFAKDLLIDGYRDFELALALQFTSSLCASPIKEGFTDVIQMTNYEIPPLKVQFHPSYIRELLNEQPPDLNSSPVLEKPH